MVSTSIIQQTRVTAASNTGLFRENDSARARTWKVIDSLPTGLKLVGRRFYSERLQRASGRPLLGELTPWLIMDLLECQETEKTQKIIDAWLEIYLSNLAFDDLLDDVDMQ